MKNTILILILSPIIYLTSCSSGGSDNPQPTIPSLIGEWHEDSAYDITSYNGDIVKVYRDNGERYWFDEDSVGTLTTYSPGADFPGNNPWKYWDFTLYDSKIYLEYQGGSTVHTQNILNFTNTNLTMMNDMSEYFGVDHIWERYSFWTKVDSDPIP